MHHEVIADRDCGACNICCVALTINDPALQKPQGYRCKNTQPDHSCAIYAARPRTCRDFNCGWRLLKWVKPPLRPDQSGVLIRLHGVASATGERRLGIAITLLTQAAIKAEGLAETVAAAILAEVPVFLTIPGPPGYTSAQARLNDVLIEPALARNKPAILEILRRARKQGSKGPRAPIVLGSPGTEDTQPPEGFDL